MGILQDIYTELRKQNSKLDCLIGMTYHGFADNKALLTQLNTTEARDVATQEELQAKIDEAIGEVSENTDVVASAVAVMSTLSQQLEDALAATDPAEAVAAVQAVVDGLNANNNALAAAVAANTEAPPEAPPEG